MTTEYEKSTGSRLSLDYVHDYFSQLNPLAERIAKTIADTKTAYGVLWYTLNTNDQNEIINETLIKPEITLHYIDNLSTKKASLTSLLQFSAPGSLTDNVMKDLNQMSLSDLQSDAEKYERNVAHQQPLAICAKQHNGFDGRSLSTFAVQRVAQKMLKDDTWGDASYRDEHSAPFSFRTRSQINFHIFNNAANSETSTKANFTLTFNLPKMINESGLPKIPANSQQINSCKKERPQAVRKGNALSRGDNENRFGKADVKGTASVKDLAFNYLHYTGGEHEAEESYSLIPAPRQHLDNETLISSAHLSSNTASDEDEHDYFHDDDDSQRQLEEVKLLDSHVTLKRGFEFLSNW